MDAAIPSDCFAAADAAVVADVCVCTRSPTRPPNIMCNMRLNHVFEGLEAVLKHCFSVVTLPLDQASGRASARCTCYPTRSPKMCVLTIRLNVVLIVFKAVFSDCVNDVVYSY